MHRVIPIVLINGYQVVKTIRFDVRRNLGNPVTVARVYNGRNVDELILLDIDASRQGRSIDLMTVQRVAEHCFMPLTVGGGIRTLEDIQQLLAHGADKIAINTAALENPAFVREASAVFGSQCIVVSIDVSGTGRDGRIYSSARETAGLDLFAFCGEMESAGAGELLINSVDRDGEMAGPDLALTRAISETVTMPVIACGGVGSPSDVVDLVENGASAVAAASIFHFTSVTPSECRDAMRSAGIPARAH